MNIILLMLPVLLLILDQTQIVSTVRTLRAGIFDLVKFPVSKIFLQERLITNILVYEYLRKIIIEIRY